MAVERMAAAAWPGPPSSRETDAVRAVGIDRSYGAIRALRDVSFSARIGEIHVLAGENGAGKTTLIKVLSGMIAADRGVVELFGDRIRAGTDATARRRLGLATAVRNPSLLPDLTVAENLLLHRPARGRFGLVSRADQVQQAGTMLRNCGMETINPGIVTAELSVAQQRAVEFVRLVAGNPRILLLDEPTAGLPDQQVEWIFSHLRRLRADGCCVVLTSHRWSEIETLADRVTVLRGGTTVTTRARITVNDAVRLMSGQSRGTGYPELPPLGPPGLAGPDQDMTGTEVLRVDGLRGGRLWDVSLSLRSGEILGVGGLAEQGQRDLFEALSGARRVTAASIEIAGRPATIRRPRDAARAGLGAVGMLDEGTAAEGLFPTLSIRDNVAMRTLSRRSTAGLIRFGTERDAVGHALDAVRVGHRRAARRPARTLPAGDQQKVLIAGWLLTKARALLLFDVTHGLDAAAKHGIYEIVVELAAQGKAILYYSSDTDELAHLSHRVIVLHDGQICAELTGPIGGAERIIAASLQGTAP